MALHLIREVAVEKATLFCCLQRSIATYLIALFSDFPHEIKTVSPILQTSCLCEKNMPRRKKWCAFRPVTRPILSSNSWSMAWLPNFSTSRDINCYKARQISHFIFAHWSICCSRFLYLRLWQSMDWLPARPAHRLRQLGSVSSLDLRHLQPFLPLFSARQVASRKTTFLLRVQTLWSE